MRQFCSLVCANAYISQAQPMRTNDVLPPAESNEPALSSVADIPDYLVETVNQLTAHLDSSVRLRVENIPKPTVAGSARVAVLFSGGIDSTMVAFLADRSVER